MVTEIEFWSDVLPTKLIPKKTFRNLTPGTIRKRMTEALEAFPGDADLWACKKVIGRDKWTEETFVFVKEGNVIREEVSE